MYRPHLTVPGSHGCEVRWSVASCYSVPRRCPQKSCKAFLRFNLPTNAYGWDRASERELTLIAFHFPWLEQLCCPTTVTDAALREIASHLSLTSLDLARCTRVTDLGLGEVSKLSSMTALNLQ